MSMPLSAPLCPTGEYEAHEKWDDIFNGVRSGKISSFEKFLCSAVVDTFAAPSLMVRSRSLQPSFVAGPRVIVSSHPPGDRKGEHVFYSFNHPLFPTGEKIEVFRFNTKDRVMNAQMLEVDPKLGVVAENPKVCQKCHGIESRPLWNRVGFWPGAIGGESLMRTEKEFEMMKEYLQKDSSKYSRYQFIQTNDLNTANLNGDLAVNNGLLDAVNANRVFRKMVSLPEYNEMKYSLAAAIMDCPDIHEFIPLKHKKGLIAFEKFDEEMGLKQIELALKSLPSVIADVGLDATSSFFINFMGHIRTDIKQYIPEKLSSFDASIKKAYQPKYAERIIAFNSKSAEPTAIDKSIYRNILLGQATAHRHESLQQANFQFDLDPLIFTTRHSLRYLLESRGISIADWSMNILEGSYELSATFLRLNEGSVLSQMLEQDTELKTYLSETTLLSPSIIENGFRVAGDPYGVCDKLKEKSLKELGSLASFPVYHKEQYQDLSDTHSNHHFSDIGKLEGIPQHIPTNPNSKRSCTQCHTAYLSNYTGPLFSRSSSNYPLTFMYCANCHSDKENNVGGFIPFNNQTKMENFLNKNPNYENRIKYRLSEEALGKLDHMPPVLLLNEKQKESILKYLKTRK